MHLNEWIIHRRGIPVYKSRHANIWVRRVENGFQAALQPKTKPSLLGWGQSIEEAMHQLQARIREIDLSTQRA